MNESPRRFMTKYYPEGDKGNTLNTDAYLRGQILVEVLKQAGDNLTRDNVMSKAASLKDVELDGLLPGIKMNTSANDFGPIQDLQLIKFKGESWERFGEVISGRRAPTVFNVKQTEPAAHP